LHGEDAKEHVKIRSLPDPERNLGRQSVVGYRVGYHFHGHEKAVKVKKPPVEPPPFCLVFGFFLLCFVNNPPGNELMRNV